MANQGFGAKGAPRFSPTAAPQTAADLEIVSDFAELVGNRKVGTRAQRLALSTIGTVENQVWNGLEFEQLDGSDAGTWKYIDGEWLLVAQQSQHQSAGAAPGSGITFPATGSNQHMTIKTGWHRSFTSAAFGNGYMPTTTFTTPFPNACLSVQITQVQFSGGPVSSGNFAIDQADRAKFRIFYPGQATDTERAYTWLAVGY